MHSTHFMAPNTSDSLIQPLRAGPVVTVVPKQVTQTNTKPQITFQRPSLRFPVQLTCTCGV